MFFDRPGFDTGSGEALSVVTRDVLGDWRKRQQDAKSTKCYIITRDPREPVRYGARPGIDPVTGRQCRQLTPELIERLREYASGNRPKSIASEDPSFFDLRTGEPIVWFYQNKSGKIELFDLMGFHPESGDELAPITKEAVELWKDQRAAEKQRQARPHNVLIPSDMHFSIEPPASLAFGIGGAPAVSTNSLTIKAFTLVPAKH